MATSCINWNSSATDWKKNLLTLEYRAQHLKDYCFFFSFCSHSLRKIFPLFSVTQNFSQAVNTRGKIPYKVISGTRSGMKMLWIKTQIFRTLFVWTHLSFGTSIVLCPFWLWDANRLARTPLVSPGQRDSLYDALKVLSECSHVCRYI